MTRKNILSSIVLFLLMAVLVLLLVFAADIKSSVQVGTLVPRRMTLADVKAHMGTTCYDSKITYGAEFGWYLPNGKFLRCGFNGYSVSPEEATEDDLLLEYIEVHDEPKAHWIEEVSP